MDGNKYMPQNKKFLKLFPIALTLGMIIFSGSLLSETQSGVSIDQAWIRYTPGQGPMAGYFVLKNSGTKRVKLCGASSAAFGGLMFHKTMVKDGQASMVMVRDCLKVNAGENLSFVPGSYHIMLMNRRSQINVGDDVTINLNFKNMAKMAVKFNVKPIGFEDY